MGSEQVYERSITELIGFGHKNILVVGYNGINRFYLVAELDRPYKNYRRLVQLNSSFTMFSLDRYAFVLNSVFFNDFR